MMKIAAFLLLFMSTAFAQNVQLQPHQVGGNPGSSKAPLQGVGVVSPLILDGSGLRCPTCLSGSPPIVAGTTPTSGIASGNLVGSSGNLAVDSGIAYANVFNASSISSGTLNTARLPAPFTSGTRSGNTSIFATVATTLGSGNCVQADVSGNLVTAASACGTAGGSNGQVQYNNGGVFAGITGATTNGTALTLVAPVLGTPASATLTNATGLPLAGVTGFATGCNTWLGTATSANLRACLTDETGTGLAYFQGGALGTPASGTLTNATGLVPSSGIAATGTPSASTYLRGDNTWSSPAGAGTVTSVGTAGLATGGPITASGTVTVTAATKTDQQTATSAVVAVTPSQQQSHPSSPKAWAVWNGSSGGLNASYGVTSVSRASAGVYTVTFSTAFASTSYACTATPYGPGLVFTTTETTSPLTTTTIGVFMAVGGTGTDPTAASIVCFGAQ